MSKKDDAVRRLAEQILAGEHDEKEKLPSERELGNVLDISLSRTTARSVYEELRGQGLVVPAERSGWKIRKIDARVITVSEAAGPESGGTLESVTHVTVWTGPVPQEIQSRLKLRDDDQVVVRESLVLDDGTEVALRTLWVPMSIAAGTVIMQAGKQDSPARMLAKAGHPATGTPKDMIRPRVAVKEERERLHVPERTACTDWIRVHQDADGTPLAVEQFLIPGDRAAIEGTFS